MTFTSDDVNFIIYRYLHESGSFVFGLLLFCHSQSFAKIVLYGIYISVLGKEQWIVSE